MKGLEFLLQVFKIISSSKNWSTIMVSGYQQEEKFYQLSSYEWTEATSISWTRVFRNIYANRKNTWLLTNIFKRWLLLGTSNILLLVLGIGLVHVECCKDISTWKDFRFIQHSILDESLTQFRSSTLVNGISGPPSVELCTRFML